MSDNAELIAEIRAEVERDWEETPGPTCPHLKLAVRAADALASVSAPVIVRTAEELDALPVGTILLAADGNIARLMAKRVEPWFKPGEFVNQWDIGGGVWHTNELAVTLPATVLFTPAP